MTPALQFANVRKRYRQPSGELLTVLDIPEFALAPGEQVALVGPSGSGKTTLLNVTAGITPVDEGEIRVGGVDLTRLPEAARDRLRAERIGIVFQSFNLLPAFSALENVQLGQAFAGRGGDRNPADLLEAVGLGDRLHSSPAQLSVGQQQRVAVARALANAPQLMLADEPTASVDLGNQERIIELLRQRCEADRIALLVITHDRRLAEQFPRMLELADFNHAAREPVGG